MLATRFGRDAALAAALDQICLHQPRFDRVLDRAAILAQLGAEGLDADRTISHECEVPAIERIETERIETELAERGDRKRSADRSS